MSKVFHLLVAFTILLLVSIIFIIIGYLVSDFTFVMAGFIIWIPAVIVFDSLRREVNHVWDGYYI